MLRQWEASPGAGEPEPARSLPEFVQKPQLQLFNWGKDDHPVLLELLRRKFGDNSCKRDEWLKALADSTAAVNAMAVASGGLSHELLVSTPNSSKQEGGLSGAPNQSVLLPGPDMSVGPNPVDVTKELILDTVDACDFPTTDVLYHVRATKKLSAISMRSDKTLYLHLDPDINGSLPLELDAPELRGRHINQLMILDNFQASYDCL